MPQLYTAGEVAERLSCTVADVEVRFQRGEIDAYNIGSLRRYALLERPAGESNPAIRFRRPESGSAGQANGRREYMRRYQREWVARRRAEFFAVRCCVDCGATEHLELDHRDPAMKVSHRIWSWSEERRATEIAKCDVRCELCHRRRHGPAHGGKRCYEAGCRCELCVTNQRERRQRRTRRPSPAVPRALVFHCAECRARLRARSVDGLCGFCRVELRAGPPHDPPSRSQPRE